MTALEYMRGRAEYWRGESETSDRVARHFIDRNEAIAVREAMRRAVDHSELASWYEAAAKALEAAQ